MNVEMLRSEMNNETVILRLDVQKNQFVVFQFTNDESLIRSYQRTSEGLNLAIRDYDELVGYQQVRALEDDFWRSVDNT